MKQIILEVPDPVVGCAFANAIDSLKEIFLFSGCSLMNSNQGKINSLLKSLVLLVLIMSLQY